ncbi:hypothetical protein [Lysinibacillus sp. G4S2]|uniref:hypothetical protein n=1 Tax=Lysinibacillus sp. G4S2 TaxID=3055859 RepID=UPI0025A1F070|nr:hypothetical protein [Lysinibacillus sp. G4S2]MDM5250695.1 hypothetical protein [Lysinibacillus sp. G4S2]
MEDSKLYATQDIGKLKQKIEAYKDTLTSLKTGTSIEDYLFMKRDFDGIKTQMALLEGLTETIDDKQNSQIEGNEEQIKLLSAQIESLNQTIEEMNQETLKVLNKLLTSENTEAPATTPKTENTSKFIANGAQRDSNITQTTNQLAIALKQPSYKMLQSLAGKAKNAQLDVNNDIPSAHNGNQGSIPEERHFNQQYFQSINTHPSQLYNGLYRNTTSKTTFLFKNATNAQEIPISVYESNTLPHTEIHNSTDNDLNAKDFVNYGELEKINNTVIIDDMSSVITNEPVTSEAAEVINKPVILEASKVVLEQDIPKASEVILEQDIPKASEVVKQVYTNTFTTSKSDVFEVFEDTPEEKYETQIQFEEVSKQSELKEEATEEGHKKEKNSLFFNFFRKWS